MSQHLYFAKKWEIEWEKKDISQKDPYLFLDLLEELGCELIGDEVTDVSVEDFNNAIKNLESLNEYFYKFGVVDTLNAMKYSAEDMLEEMRFIATVAHKEDGFIHFNIS